MNALLNKKLEEIQSSSFRNISTGLFHIHIPKTGGSITNLRFKECETYFNGGHSFGVESVPMRGHAPHWHRGLRTWPTYIYDERFQRTIRFAVIRNPMEWIFSYFYHNRKPQLDHYGWASAGNYHDFETFEEFVEAFLDPDFKWHCEPVRAFQIAQCFDLNGKCRADFLVYNENLDTAMSYLANLLGYSLEGTRSELNKGAHRSKYSTSDDIERRLKFHFRDEMRLFGYRDDGSVDPALALIPSDGVFAIPDKIKFDVETNRLQLL